jgi:hypothetical protein
VYGRVGYEQPYGTPQLGAGSSLTDVSKRQPLGLNYGIGLRYDLNPAMGVRFEWARPYRNANVTATGVSDPRPNEAPDQVSVGIQFKF